MNRRLAFAIIVALFCGCARSITVADPIPMGPMSEAKAINIAIREAKKNGLHGPFKTEVTTHAAKVTEHEWGTVLIIGKRVGEDAYIRLSGDGEVLEFRFARHGPDHW